MSKSVSPTLIGGFIAGSMALVVGILVVMGSANIFSTQERFVLYFDESINGLVEGAPVKFKGVPIGRVTEIKIRFNQDNLSEAIPVFIEIDVDRLQNQLGVEVDLADEAILAQQIRDGLRGQLEVESLITGLLFVELNYVSGAPIAVLVQDEPEILEIPTVSSPFAEFGETASNIASLITSLDIGSMVDELTVLLRNANVAVESIDVVAINDSVISTSEAIGDLARNPQITEAILNLNGTLAELQDAISRLEAGIHPVLEGAAGSTREIDATLAEVRAALTDFRAAALAIGETTTDVGALRSDVQRTLREISDAAREARLFLDYLERNPRALLTGRADEGP